MRTSDTVREVAKALAVASKTMGHAGKDRQNPHLRNRYATLEAVIDAVRIPLADAGISILQAGDVSGSMVTVTTRLLHESGEWVEGSLQVAVPEPKGITAAQALGSAMTYGRRYTLAALCGIGSEEDDDGAGTGKSRPARPAKPETVEQEKAPEKPAPAEHHPSWEGDRAGFCAELSRLGTTYDKVCADLEHLKRPRPSAMTGEQRAKTLQWLATRSLGGAK